MPHLTCPACHGRVWREGGPGAPSPEVCPDCGGPLDDGGRPAGGLRLRALRARPDAGRSIADQVRAAVARNDAARRRRLRAEARRSARGDAE